MDVFFSVVPFNGSGQRQIGGYGKGDSVLGGVVVVDNDNAPEVVCVLHRVIFDFHQNRSESFNDSGHIVIGRLAIDGGEYFCGVFEGEGDLFGR